MRQTRRQFIGTTIAALAAGRAIASVPSSPARQSLAAFSSDPAKVATLRKGIAAMKALPASDHRSWFFQAATHAYSETLYADELTRDPRLADVDKAKFWNQCPHFGQCSADFVIWHRAYLHHFERTLRVMSGDPTFALPYWDYGKPEGRVFPAIYIPEFVDAAKRIPNPLFHPNRERSFTRGLVEISAAIGEASKTRGAATFFHEVGVPGFGGDILDSGHTQIGLLEQRPHNDIHVAVGGVVGSTNGAMAEITTAAFDPIFWAHHTNIDRLWAEWASRPGKSWGPLPSEDWFDERPWIFIDADGTEVTVSRREAIAMTANYDVGYPDQLAVPVSTPPPPQSTGGGVRGPSDDAPATAMPPMVGAAPPPPPRKLARRPVERELLSDATPIIVAPRRAGRRKLGDNSKADLGADLDVPEFGSDDVRVYLELSDIAFQLVPSSGFAVYIDIAGQPPSDEPVGLIDIFGATHHAATAGMHKMGAAQRFDVTAVLRRSKGPFTLRVEPYALLVAPGGKLRGGRGDAVTIGAVRFVVTR